jgi:hypothetical protein
LHFHKKRRIRRENQEGKNKKGRMRKDELEVKKVFKKTLEMAAQK